MFTPNNITELKENEIFVFGSNKAGNHAGGAAKVAVEKFGAIIGQGEGLQGQSYAFPTLDEHMQKVTSKELVNAFENLCECATQHKDKIFYLTKVGCGIAGFSEDEIIEAINKVELPDNVIIPKEFNVIYSYKAFDKDMTCRGFVYKEGKSYEEEVAVACNRGFHACRNPFDVLDYYPLVGDNGNFSRFAEVVQSGDIDEKDNKTCSSKIKIKAEIGLPGFIHACVEWVKEKTSPDKVKVNVPDSGYSAKIGSSGDSAKIGSSGDSAQIGSSGYSAKIGSSGDSAQIGSSGDSAQIGSSGYSAKIGSSGYSAQIGSSGDSAQIGSSGYSAKIGSSGDSAKIGSSGDSAKIGSSGDYAKIGSSGYSAQIGSSGDYAKIGSSGYSAQIGSSGDYAKIGSSGDSAQIGSSGDSAQIGSSGYSAQIGSSGYSAQIGSSGYSAQIGSSGDYAKIGSSGDYAKIQSTGNDSVIMCAGYNSIASAKKGSWITLSEWKKDEEKNAYVPACVKTEYVDGNVIKEDTFYKLVNGKFTEI